MLGDEVGEPIGNFKCLFRAAKIGGGDVGVEGGLHALLEELGFGLPAEEFEHHAGGKDRAERVGDALSGDVGRGTVDGLEERGLAGVNVGGRCEAEAAGELRGEVRDDVAEKVVGDDDVELAGIADKFHGEGVDVEVAGVDFGIFGAEGFEGALPEVASEGHGVGLVGHAEAEGLARGDWSAG